MNQPWKIEEGLKLIRALQGRVKEFGYHIALGGGVLNTGTSEKDLDLYFLPFNNPNIAKEDTDGLLDWLTKLWGDPKPIGEYPDLPDDDQIHLQPFPLQPRLPRPVRRLRADLVMPVVPVMPPPPQFLVNEDEPMPAQPPEYQWAQPKAKQVSSYRYKLKFERIGNDRIDVFII